MDKFDQSFKDAKLTYEPNTNFMEVTMQKINKRQPKRRPSTRVWLLSAAGGLAVIALLLVLLPFGIHNDGMLPASLPNSSSSQSPQGSSTDGTDNASLVSDLNGINNAVGQENTDQSSANSSLNDQSQQIVVPTN